MIHGVTTIVHQLDGRTHRSNGPAAVWPNGDWVWMKDGRRHRYYGKHSIGGLWYINGKFVK